MEYGQLGDFIDNLLKKVQILKLIHES